MAREAEIFIGRSPENIYTAVILVRRSKVGQLKKAASAIQLPKGHRLANGGQREASGAITPGQSHKREESQRAMILKRDGFTGCGQTPIQACFERARLYRLRKNSRQTGFVTGPDFSRADKPPGISGALAPRGWF
jgi:hypothetical protein